jgi:hypothetical protein
MRGIDCNWVVLDGTGGFELISSNESRSIINTIFCISFGFHLLK